MKKCNGCKRTLEELSFTRKNKIHARCNDCSSNASCKTNICEICGINAIYNIEGLKWGRFCKTHKELGMVDIKNKKCIYSGCKTIPFYNKEGETKGLYCSIHKEPGMINVKDKVCIHPGCKTIPFYNKEGETKGLYCSIHKENNMVNVKDKVCIHPGCKTIPFYNKEGETKGLYCSIHKENNMVNVKSKTCIHPGCKIIPTYNKEGETKGLYCSIHKENNMVNVKAKTCIHPGCKIQPIYNKEGEPKGLFCDIHKEPGMINVKDKICIHPGCKTLPTYNKEAETKALYCNIHKEDNMVNVRNKKCIHPGCKTIPNYNKEGETKGLYCNDHKEPEMIDIKNKTCIYPGCKTICNFGYCSQSPCHCAQHKLDYMIIKPKRICLGNDEEECKDMAIYGNDKPLHCEDHKLEGEICWLVKKCENCGRDKELLNREGLCGMCCDKPFYEESKRINKMKETIMVKYLRDNIKENKEILADRIIDSTCNLYRPDILYDCGTHIVVAECDENQHKNYPWESCSLNKSLEHMEEKRMYEIMVAYGLPAIFIRWNPDNFNVNGSINKKYNNSKRLEMLVKWVNYCMKMEVEPGVIYKKLFYDEYEEGDMSFKKIEEADLI
jgi:hypothetical protein